jgi:DNA-binding NarL/FixJ family response regulator
MAIRCVLADDDALVRAGIGMLLEAEKDVEVVAEVGDGAGAVAAVRDLRPDVAIVDVRMPGMDGVEATRRIASDEVADEAGCTTAVLVLTTYLVDEAVYACLRQSTPSRPENPGSIPPSPACSSATSPDARRQRFHRRPPCAI